jgi:cysteinyl-tRNA synthetase
VLQEGIDKLQRLGGVLGLFASDSSAWLEGQKKTGLEDKGLSADEIEKLIAERKQARLERDFARSDQIRDELAARGVVLLDTKDGTTWKLQS